MRPAPRRTPPVGFTLMELVVVLVIVGVVVGIAGPAFVIRGAAHGDDAAAPVVGLLTRARRTAIESARLTTVTIDPRTARAWVRTEGREPNVDTTLTLALAGDASLEATGPRARFTFDPRGGATSDPLTVTSAAGRQRIDLDRATGDVRVTSSADGTGNRAP